jgi:integrase
MWHEQFTDKDDNIKYRFYERFKDPLTDKNRRTSVVMNKNTRPSQNEAQKLLNAKIEQLIKTRLGTNTEIQDKTFHEVANEWLEEYKRTHGSKPGTVKGKETQVRQLLSYIDPDAKFVKVGFRHLQDFIYYKSDEGLKQRSLDAYAIVIRAIYAYARTGEYNFKPEFDVNDLKIPKDKMDYEAAVAEDDSNKYLTQKEIDDILAYLDDKVKQRKRADVQRNLKMIQYIIEFQVLNGMRISELLAIQPHNIDFDNQTLLIDGSIYWGSSSEGFGYKDTTKTKGSRRRIGLTQRSMDILKWVMLENKKEASWNDRYTDKGYVFTGSTGSPMPKDKVNDALKEAATSTGISKHKKVTSHILRHTHISVLASLDVGIKTIMERVGHSDYRTTLQIYTHVTDKMNETMMDKLEKANY